MECPKQRPHKVRFAASLRLPFFSFLWRGNPPRSTLSPLPWHPGNPSRKLVPTCEEEGYHSGLDLETLTFWIPFIFPFNEQPVKGFAGGFTAPKTETSCPLVGHCPAGSSSYKTFAPQNFSLAQYAGRKISRRSGVLGPFVWLMYCSVASVCCS